MNTDDTLPYLHPTFPCFSKVLKIIIKTDFQLFISSGRDTTILPANSSHQLAIADFKPPKMQNSHIFCFVCEQIHTEAEDDKNWLTKAFQGASVSFLSLQKHQSFSTLFYQCFDPGRSPHSQVSNTLLQPLYLFLNLCQENKESCCIRGECVGKINLPNSTSNI